MKVEQPPTPSRELNKYRPLHHACPAFSHSATLAPLPHQFHHLTECLDRWIPVCAVCIPSLDSHSCITHSHQKKKKRKKKSLFQFSQCFDCSLYVVSCKICRCNRQKDGVSRCHGKPRGDDWGGASSGELHSSSTLRLQYDLDVLDDDGRHRPPSPPPAASISAPSFPFRPLCPPP